MTAAILNDSILACPVCQETISISDNVMRCTNNHCFDRAKQGYWNLLAVQQKKSKDPGDNPQMVIARKQFLDLNHYLPLAEAIADILKTISDNLAAPTLTNNHSINILDMGCGEGYYTSYWQKKLTQKTSSASFNRQQLNFFGLDISKHAIKAATQRNKSITWLVASGAKMPIAKQSLDTLIVVFSRLMPQPFADVLKEQASLVLVWPTDQHLIELKHAMYDQVKASSYNPQQQLDPLFSLCSKQRLHFTFSLDNEEALTTLLEMTPHGQRINADKKRSLLTRLPIELTFDVNIAHFSKRIVTAS